MAHIPAAVAVAHDARSIRPSVPPGQYVVDDFRVLSTGPTPRPQLDDWSFTIHGAVDGPVSWPWEAFVNLPTETFTGDIHCVTKWSKLDTSWTSVSVDTLLEGVETEADHVAAWCDGGYTTNLPRGGAGPALPGVRRCGATRRDDPRPPHPPSRGRVANRRPDIQRGPP